MKKREETKSVENINFAQPTHFEPVQLIGELCVSFIALCWNFPRYSDSEQHPPSLVGRKTHDSSIFLSCRCSKREKC